jgi:nickel-dependent lactate racemase
VQAEIPFGKDIIKLKIIDSNMLDVIKSKDGNALNSPIKSKKLSDLAKGKNSCCILVSDIRLYF